MLWETSAYKFPWISKYSRENFFLLKGNSAIRFSYWNDDSEKLNGFRKNGSFDYIPSHMKVFLGNEYNSYIHTARNAKVTSTRIVYEKTLMKPKVFRGVFRTHSNIYNEAFLRRQLTEWHTYIVKVVDWVLNTPLVLIITEKLPRRKIACIHKQSLRAIRWLTYFEFIVRSKRNWFDILGTNEI